MWPTGARRGWKYARVDLSRGNFYTERVSEPAKLTTERRAVGICALRRISFLRSGAALICWLAAPYPRVKDVFIMAEAQYLTPEGKESLERELDELKNVRRPELAIKLAEAVSMGDLKENADYHDAKEQQGFIEGRIKHIEAILRGAIVVEASNGSGVVNVGSRVTIVEDGTSDEEVYTIVGAAEASPKDGKISNESPVGAALIGRKKGDKVKVTTPGGVIIFKVKKVE
jgi:transcription elongation factor GreA